VKIKRIRDLFFKKAPAIPVYKDREMLGVVAIMKNEGMNLCEWIDHYLWQGVNKIFLIDNGSTDESATLVQPYVERGVVEFYSRPERHLQCSHYQTVFIDAQIQRKVEWLIMADLDEFWFSPGSRLSTTLRKIIEINANVDLIYANWLVFGSSGYKDHPPNLRQYFIHRHAEIGQHVNTKWICKTDSIVDSGQIMNHKVHGIDSSRVVSDNEHFHLNHYAIQSLEYFTKIKMERGDVSSSQLETVRTLDYFNRYDAPATHVDRTLADMCANQTPPQP
jgi:hypothetical protein